MQASLSTTASDSNPWLAHDDIALCALNLWLQSGSPANRDLAIWLEAEQRLLSASRAQNERRYDRVPEPSERGDPYPHAGARRRFSLQKTQKRPEQK